MKPDNSPEYAAWKSAERLAGRLNAANRGPRGFGPIVAARCGRPIHPLACQCIACVPPEVRAWIASKPDVFPLLYWEFCHESELPLAPVKRPAPAPATPKHGHKATKGYGRPRRKWDQRCSCCGGTGEIRDLSGSFIPCPRCTE